MGHDATQKEEDNVSRTEGAAEQNRLCLESACGTDTLSTRSIAPRQRPQSSSASRVPAGAFGFMTLSQSGDCRAVSILRLRRQATVRQSIHLLPRRARMARWTFHLVYKLAAAFRQFSCDDACPSCNLQARDWNKKYCLTDIELMHGASLKLLHYRTYELL